jgi:hypothetical protein
MASGLAHLAENLDQAISKGSKDKPEPVFLGKAAEVVQRLHFGFTGWLKEYRTEVFDLSYRVGLFLLGAVFLHSLGADHVTATAIGTLGYILKSPLRKKKRRKK